MPAATGSQAAWNWCATERPAPAALTVRNGGRARALARATGNGAHVTKSVPSAGCRAGRSMLGGATLPDSAARDCQ
jgi:hypothetical protein